MNQTVVVRMRFRQWIGKSVFHCHIAPHENVGMMQNFLIVDPAQVSTSIELRSLFSLHCNWIADS